jgi:hypothetical protein
LHATTGGLQRLQAIQLGLNQGGNERGETAASMHHNFQTIVVAQINQPLKLRQTVRPAAFQGCQHALSMVHA